MVADADGQLFVFEQLLLANAFQRFNQQMLRGEVCLAAQNDGVLFCVEAQHVGGLAQGDAEALALTYGVEGHTLVRAQTFAACIYVTSAIHSRRHFGPLLAQEIAVVVFNEAYLH